MVQGSPVAEPTMARVPLYGPDFAGDPHAAYARMRHAHGGLVPVELMPGVPATLVVAHRAAVRIMNDPEHFPADPRRWQKTLAPDNPLMMMMGARPNALRTAGTEHARLRAPIVAGLAHVDLHALHDTVERTAIPLINAFCRRGHADLRADYAFPLAFSVLRELMGLSAADGEEAFAGMAAILDSVSAADAVAGNHRFEAALRPVVRQRRGCPLADVTSRMVQHPAALTDEEMVQQAALIFSAGTEPTTSVITTTILLLLTDPRFRGQVEGGAMETRDALHWALFREPPLPNFCTVYPVRPMCVDDTWLPADQPVLISIAACNTDPAVFTPGVDLTGNRSHLSWGVGAHACMAEQIARIIAGDAIDQLLDALPEISLALPVEALAWRPGAVFQRALTALPVTFPPSPPLTTG